MQGLDVDVGACCGVGPACCCADTIQGRVRQEADWLFKRLGEAHAVLSDAAARRKVWWCTCAGCVRCMHAQLDLELQLHETRVERGSRSFSHRGHAPAYEYSAFRRTASAYPRAWGHVPRGVCAEAPVWSDNTRHRVCALAGRRERQRGGFLGALSLLDVNYPHK